MAHCAEILDELARLKLAEAPQPSYEYECDYCDQRCRVERTYWLDDGRLMLKGWCACGPWQKVLQGKAMDTN